MGLVNSADLSLKNSSSSFLQNFAKLPKKMLDTDGKWSKVQKLLKSFFPVTGKGWLYGNVRKQDWTILQTETLTGPFPIPNIAVPRFRGLPENYR